MSSHRHGQPHRPSVKVHLTHGRRGCQNLHVSVGMHRGGGQRRAGDTWGCQDYDIVRADSGPWVTRQWGWQADPACVKVDNQDMRSTVQVQMQCNHGAIYKWHGGQTAVQTAPHSPALPCSPPSPPSPLIPPSSSSSLVDSSTPGPTSDAAGPTSTPTWGGGGGIPTRSALWRESRS